MIVQTAFIGDVVLVEPLLARALALFPRAAIDIVVIPAAANLLETHPAVHEVIVYDKRGRHRGWRGFWALRRRLQSQRYDVALVPHRSLRSALLVWLAGIPERIGFDTSAGRLLFTHQIPYRQVHEVERNLSLLAPFGESPHYQRPAVYPTAADRLQAVALLPPDKTPLIALAPGSVWATKRWPIERFTVLGQKFLQQTACRVVLLGGASDYELCTTLAAQLGDRCFNLAGKLTLRQSVALLARCSVLVTNDSAPTHLGVAAGCRVVTIFGATVPRFGFFPNGVHHRIVETEQTLACRPCGIHGGHKCPVGTFECMLSISSERVFRTAKEILHGQETGPVSE